MKYKEAVPLRLTCLNGCYFYGFQDKYLQFWAGVCDLNSAISTKVVMSTDS